MAKILTNTPDNLVVTLFGKSVECSKQQGGQVLCHVLKYGLTEKASEVLAAMNRGISWFASPSPRATVDFGPIFRLYFRFLETPEGEMKCFAVHDKSLGNPDNSSEILDVLTTVANWLVAAGVI